VANRYFMDKSERGVLVTLSSVFPGPAILSYRIIEVCAYVARKGWPGTAGFDEFSQELKICQGGPFAWPLARDIFLVIPTHSPCSGQLTYTSRLKYLLVDRVV